MTKGFTIFFSHAGASLYFYIGIEFLEKQMLVRASGEDEMLLHSAIFMGGK